MIRSFIKLSSVVANIIGLRLSSGRILKWAGAQFFAILFMILGGCSNQLAENELEDFSENEIKPSLSKLILVNAVTQKDIGELVDNYSFNASPVNIRVEGTAASVVFQLTGTESDVQSDNAMPYTFKGDIEGIYNSWKPGVGKYSLKATPYSQRNAKGVPGNPITVNFVAVAPPVVVPTPVVTSASLLFFGKSNDATIATYGGGHTLQPWYSDLKKIGISEFGIVSPSAYTKVEMVTDNGVKVLHAQIIGNNPNDAGRFQGSTYLPTRDMGVYHHSQRMKIGADVSYITNYSSAINAKSGDGWFTIFETWMGQSVSRMNLGLSKAAGVGTPIKWELACEWEEGSSTPYKSIWPSMLSSVPVPFGKWFTMDVYIKSGEGSNGQIKITITVDGAAPIVLFDVKNTTTVPDNPTIYRRKTDHMKFYVGKTLRKFMLDKGKALEVFFGDYKIFKD
jgi:hypothetical protein